MAKINIRSLNKASNKSSQSASSFEGVLQFLNKDIKLFQPINHKTKESLYHELSMLLTAGVDLKAALDLIVGEQKKDYIKGVFEDIRQSVLMGDSLSGALEKQKMFTPYEYFSIQIGEETGRITSVLNNLASYFKKQIKQRRQIIGALMYPSIVTLTAVGAVFFMLNFIVPMFADIFNRSGDDLPSITRVIISASTFIKAYSIPVFIVLVVFALVLYSQRKKERFRNIASMLILKVPFFGEMARKIYVGRFCNSMTLLTSANVPLVKAIQLSRQMSGFYPIEKSLLEVERMIVDGVPLYKSLSAYSIYDAKMISLIKVGEEVNELSVFFGKIDQQYNEEVEHQSSLLSSVMEPFIIIFLGLFVGIILVAMYLPLFQLGNSFG